MIQGKRYHNCASPSVSSLAAASLTATAALLPLSLGFSFTMDFEAATGEIDSTAGGSVAGPAEHELNQQGEDGSPSSLAQPGGDEESNEVDEEAAMEGKHNKRGRGEGEEEGTAKKERKRRSIAREGPTPVDRPSRERKRVERFAAMSPRKISVPKTPSFEQVS